MVHRVLPGRGKLIVAIADVAAYVPPGGELDKAAKNRGTSVYLPDRVLPHATRSDFQ